MKKKVNIHIGEYHASREPTIIYTILGSCVAVCLMDMEDRIGGMNHILLPGRPDLKSFDSSARYGINAMELLINSILKLGGNRDRIVAKVFGGAHIIPVISRDNSVGTRITEFVKSFLDREGMKIISQDTGGRSARKLFFHTDSGDVFLKYINRVKYADSFRSEKRRSWDVRKEVERPGEVVIFKDINIRNKINKKGSSPN